MNRYISSLSIGLGRLGVKSVAVLRIVPQCRLAQEKSLRGQVPAILKYFKVLCSMQFQFTRIEYNIVSRQTFEPTLVLPDCL